MRFDGMRFSEEELKLVFESLENNKEAMEDALEQDCISNESKSGIQAERDLAHDLMVRIAEYWAREESWELRERARVLFDQWQNMSDAKSNGACAGCRSGKFVYMTIRW